MSIVIKSEEDENLLSVFHNINGKVTVMITPKLECESLVFQFESLDDVSAFKKMMNKAIKECLNSN